MENSPVSRHHSVALTIKERYLLTKEGSSKQTFHVILDLTQNPLTFQPGDSIAIYPQNDPLLIDHLINAMRGRGNEMITDPRSGKNLSLREFLTHKANLARLTSSFLKLFYAYEPSHDKKNRLGHLLEPSNRPLLIQYLSSHDPLDLFREYQETTVPLQELCSQFGPILPRFYSVASSPSVYKEEAHLTVALFSFTHQGEQRYGVGSHFLCSLAIPRETSFLSYVQPATHFHLPADDATPIILVGPGTGIAPYRAFLQERIARRAPGKNWLFFGERNRAFDYLYEEEIEGWKKKGQLKLDLAFSRDQQEKIYVQHKMLEHAKELFHWLESGAIFYVCGDAHHMAKDVDHALHTLVKQEAGLNELGAKAYVKALRASKRYLADVY